MKFIPNTDAADITGVTAGTGLSGGGTSGGVTLNVDAAQPTITSLGTLTGLTLDGDKSVTPGDGAMIHLDASIITDSNTAESGTAALYTHVRLEGPKLAAAGVSVTTTDAATLYIKDAVGAHTNQTITNAYSLWVDAGNARFDGDLHANSHIKQTLGDYTLYDANNDANPTISLGSSATNRLKIEAEYNGGAQTLNEVNFTTYTASGSTNDGRFNFYVDEVVTLSIKDELMNLTGALTTLDYIACTNTTTSSATEGGKLILQSDDGAVMGDNHRLGVIEFTGAEDTSSTLSIGARIQAIARDAWDGSNNDADLEFYTTDGTTESLVLTLDADKLATFTGAVTATGALTGTLATVSQPNITGVGTIGTGVWQGTAIASAYLDADTAHLSTQKQLTHHNFSADIDTTKYYIGFTDGDAESTSTGGSSIPIIAPAAGKLLKVFLRSNKNLNSLTFTWRLETQAGVNFGTGPSVVGTQSGAGCQNSTMTTYDFTTSLDSGDNLIDAGDAVYLSIQSGGATSSTKFYITCLWEWDLS